MGSSIRCRLIQIIYTMYMIWIRISMMICQLAVLAADPRQLFGTFLGLAYKLLNRSFERVLEQLVAM